MAMKIPGFVLVAAVIVLVFYSEWYLPWWSVYDWRTVFRELIRGGTGIDKTPLKEKKGAVYNGEEREELGDGSTERARLTSLDREAE